MNQKEIESLKAVIMRLIRQGCSLQSDSCSVEGKIVGVGFKPYWTNPLDSKIEKLEFNFIDRFGRIVPFYFHNVVGYEVASHDGKRFEDANNISLDIRVFSPKKAGSKEPYDKVRINLSCDAVPAN